MKIHSRNKIRGNNIRIQMEFMGSELVLIGRIVKNVEEESGYSYHIEFIGMDNTEKTKLATIINDKQRLNLKKQKV